MLLERPCMLTSVTYPFVRQSTSSSTSIPCRTYALAFDLSLGGPMLVSTVSLNSSSVYKQLHISHNIGVSISSRQYDVTMSPNSFISSSKPRSRALWSSMMAMLVDQISKRSISSACVSYCLLCFAFHSSQSEDGRAVVIATQIATRKTFISQLRPRDNK